MDLKCRKTVCIYNEDYCCCAKGIDIKRDSACATFKNDNKKQGKDSSKNMFEAAPDMHPYRHAKKVDIVCEAPCLFNDNFKCKANGITVYNGKTPNCITFIEK